MTTYTREQILSMPTGHSLDCMAAKLMGWTRSIAWEGRYWADKDGCNRWELSQWKPSSYFEPAMTLEEHIKQIGGLMIGYYMTELILIVGNKGFDMVHATPEQRTKAAILAMIEQSGGTGDE